MAPNMLPPAIVFERMSGVSHGLSGSVQSPSSSGLVAAPSLSLIAATEDVTTTRLTPAFRLALRTRTVPSRAGTIAAVTFLGGFIPYLGAWAAGAFAVLIALGSSGPETAGALAVIVLLANGALQQMVQPVAYGATLGIHPLAVLIVTIAGGSMFGAIGLILAAPLTAAAVHISADLARARAEHEAEQEAGPEPAGPTEPGASPSSA